MSFDPIQYYSIAEKLQVSRSTDAVVKWSKELELATLYYNAWTVFRNGFLNNNGGTFADPITNAGNWYPGNAEPTVTKNLLGWYERMKKAQVEFPKAEAALQNLVDGLYKKYYAIYQRDTTTVATQTAAQTQQYQALAEVQSGEFWRENAVPIIVAIIIIIFIIIRFRK